MENNRDFDQFFSKILISSLENNRNNAAQDVEVAARELFKVFTSFCKAGFTEEQAIALLGVLIQAASNNGK